MWHRKDSCNCGNSVTRWRPVSPIQRYLDGETTLAEERLLTLALSRKESLTTEEQIILAMLGELTVDEAIYDEIMAERQTLQDHTPLTPISVSDRIRL